MALATQADVEARLGRVATAAEVARLPSLLEDADAAVIGYCGTDFESILRAATIEADDDIVTLTETHGLSVGDRVKFTALTGGTGITVGTRYFVNALPSTETFTASATDGGASVNITVDATAATYVRYPKAVVGVVAKMVARALERAGSTVGSFVDQQNAGPFGVRYSASTSDGDVWLTKGDKLALRPHRQGGGLTSVGLVGERYEITES